MNILLQHILLILNDCPFDMFILNSFCPLLEMHGEQEESHGTDVLRASVNLIIPWLYYSSIHLPDHGVLLDTKGSLFVF